jgi:hypothetical protein
MRFLRMFTNSLLAGGLCAAYLTVIVLQLNPHVPLLSGSTWRWFLTLGVTYGLHLAVLFYALIVTREFFSMGSMSPGWASVRVLAWLSAIGATVAAVLMWLNLNAFRAVLGEVASRRMTAGAFATTASAVVLLGIAVAHYSYGRRGSRVGGALFSLAALGSLVLPLAARGPAVPEPDPPAWSASAPPAPNAPGRPRVRMLLLDGASLEYIRTRSTAGRLPGFSKLLEGGASMYLATIRPTQPGPVWAAVATGMYPSKTGVRSASRYFARGESRPIYLLPDHCFSHALVQLGAVHAETHTSAAWGARPLWSILTRAGISSGVVRWPFTHPAPPTLGFVVTDHFHDLFGPEPQFDEQATYPPDLLTAARASIEAPDGENGGDVDVYPEAAAARRDRLYSRALRAIGARSPVQLTALRLQAIDTAGHRQYEDSQPSRLRDGAESERRARAEQMERAYAASDAEVGRALETLAPGDILLVISGFGMQRLNPAKELLARMFNDPVTRGTHERAPDGFLVAYGDAVQPGRRPRGSIVDVTPTILYYLGIPVGRDMDGFARTDLFTGAFTAGRPIAFIATHNR